MASEYMKSARRWGWRGSGALALLAVVASGCGPAEAPWKVEPVWADGEEARYEVHTGEALVTGHRIWTVEARADGWVVRTESNQRGRSERSEVTLDAALSPLSSWRETGSGRSEVTYSNGQAAVVQKPVGAPPRESTLPVTADVVDNEAALQVYRGLALREGERASSLTVVPASGRAVRISVEGGPVEKVDVPAGTFEVRCLSLRGTGQAQRACYAAAAPHVLVSYENPGAKTKMVLRAYRAGKEAAWQGDPAPPELSRDPVPVRWSLVAVTVLVSLPLMLVFPLWLGFWLRRRFGVDLKLWGAGALTFVASQVVHLPLNYALGMLGQPRALGLLPLPWLALAAGLSAGLCEELARFAAWRLVLKKRRRTYEEALQFGAGHGGVEAMILGALAVAQVGGMVALSMVPLGTLGIPAEQAGTVEAARDTFWLTPAYMGALGGLERLFAIALHVACSVLVVRAVARRQALWLVAAIALHTAMNAAAMWTVLRFGAVAAEGVTALFGGLALLIVRRSRGAGGAGSGEAGEPARQVGDAAGGGSENT